MSPVANSITTVTTTVSFTILIIPDNTNMFVAYTNILTC